MTIDNNITKQLITYDQAIVLVKDEVDRALSTSPLIIRGFTKHLTKSHGKFIRAVSLIACAQDYEEIGRASCRERV